MEHLKIDVDVVAWDGTNFDEIKEFVEVGGYFLDQIDYKTLIFDNEFEVLIGWYFIRSSSVFYPNDFERYEVVAISPETYRKWREEINGK